jgi:hypothetical protein
MANWELKTENGKLAGGARRVMCMNRAFNATMRAFF